MNKLQWSYFEIMMVMMIDDERKETKYTQQTSENVKLIKIESVLYNFTFAISVPRLFLNSQNPVSCRTQYIFYAKRS
jgi:hypothetical protein